jgi:glycerophosphoryl diester phosphodiesterase
MDAVAEPMLDLKGAEPRAAEAVLALVEQVRPGRPFTVCSQQWPVLQPFQGVATARVVYSIGNAGQLRRALRYLVGRECAGVAIHQRLLTAETVTALLGVAPRILTWPVNTPARLQELLARGVDGIISDSLPLLQRLVQQRARAEEQRTPLIRAADR